MKRIRNNNAKAISELAYQLPFVYGLENLRKWRAKLNLMKAAGDTIIDIAVLGASASEGETAGENTNDVITKGWVGRLRTALASKYGDVGLGFLPARYPTLYPYIIYSGTWSTPLTYGICGIAMRTLENGATASWSFNGTGIRIAFAKSGAHGTISYNIDSGAKTDTINLYNATILPAVYTDITGLDSGDHTITLTKSDDGKPIHFIGFAPIKGTSGVRVNMAATKGTSTADAVDEVRMAAEINLFSPALTIIGYGSNDFSRQMPLTTFRSSLETLVDRALTFGDVLLTSIGVRTDENTPAIPQSAYRAVIKDVAATKGCAYFDIADRWGGGAAASANGLLSGTVHPNAGGHYDIGTSTMAIIDA